MRFEETYTSWQTGGISQEEAARILGVSDRTYRRYMKRYEVDGIDGLSDKRIEQASHRCAPVDEICRLTDLYSSRYVGWNVKHFYSWYQQDGGGRSYTWVKNRLQAAGLVKKAKAKGKHRKKRQRSKRR